MGASCLPRLMRSLGPVSPEVLVAWQSHRQGRMHWRQSVTVISIIISGIIIQTPESPSLLIDNA